MTSIIVFQVLSQFPSLDWLHPFLITTGFPGLIDVMRDPIPLDQIWDSTLLAGCYLLIGTGLAAMRLITKDN